MLPFAVSGSNSPINSAVLLWDESKISIAIEQAFRRGEILKRAKTKASKAPVPMCEALATTLSEFRQETQYEKDEDFVLAIAADP